MEHYVIERGEVKLLSNYDEIEELDIKYGQIFQNKAIELHNISKKVKNIMA